MNQKTVYTLLIVTGVLLIIIGIFFAVNVKNSDVKNNADGSKEGRVANVLETIYKTFEISDKMNGYTMIYILSGEYQEKSYFNNVSITNYNNKKYMVLESAINNQSSTYSDVNTYVIIDGITYLKMSNGQYLKTDENYIYSNIEVYLRGLVSGKKIEYMGKMSMTIDEVKYEFDQYNFSIDAKVMEEVLKATNVSGLSFEKDVDCVALIDENGYVNQLEYKLSSGLGSDTYFSLVLYFVDYNNINDFEIVISNDLVNGK